MCVIKKRLNSNFVPLAKYTFLFSSLNLCLVCVTCFFQSIYAYKDYTSVQKVCTAYFVCQSRLF